MSTEEIFKPYYLAPKYKVGNMGTIIGIYGKILKPVLHRKNNGYYKVFICNGKIRNLFVHRIVAEVHLNDNKPIPAGYQVNHINKITNINSAENLEIITQYENIQHRSFGIKENLPF